MPCSPGVSWSDICSFITASGRLASATGDRTIASGLVSTATGSITTASGAFSTAMGDSTTASGAFSTATGDRTVVSGLVSTAMGSFNTESGRASTAMGAYKYTDAQSIAEVVIVRYNELSPLPSPGAWDAADAILRVGNGTTTHRSNALRVMKSGVTQIKALEATTLEVGGTDVMAILASLQAELA